MSLKSFFSKNRVEHDVAVSLGDQHLRWAKVQRGTGELADLGCGASETEVRKLLKGGRSVRVLMSGRGTFYCVVDREVLDLERLSDEIPFPPKSYQVRHLPIPSLRREGGTSHFVAAARDDEIARLKELIEGAGLTIQALEVPATVLARTGQSFNTPKGATILQIHVGHRDTQFVLSIDGHPYVAREIAKGRRELLFHYSQYTQCDSESAEAGLAKLSVESPGPVEPVIDSLIEQALRTTRQLDRRVHYVSVTGSGRLPGFSARVAERLGARSLPELSNKESEYALVLGLATS